jgi:hypothetical protein
VTTRCALSAHFRTGIAVILELSDLQILDTVPLDRVVPRKELFDRQDIAAANLVDCDPAAVHRFHDSALRRAVQRWVSGGGNSTAAVLVRGKPKSRTGF